VNKEEFTDEDGQSYADAGIRVGATRWATEAAPVPKPGLSVVTSPGQPGETCVSLLDASHDQKNPLLKRCTYGVVWAVSARAKADGSALTLAVQPMEAWRELWLFHQTSQGWIVDILPPAISNPDVGYAEFSGWVPGTNKMLVTRESHSEKGYKRSFEVVNIDSLKVENYADHPDSLSAFHRWQDVTWKRQTVSLR
jgi:hypothetical protein